MNNVNGPHTINKDRLCRFLSEWLSWAEAGAPPDRYFRAHIGLCGNLDRWLGRYGEPEDVTPPTWRTRRLLRAYLKESFGEGRNYPFGGINRYNEENEQGLAFANTSRKWWVANIITRIKADAARHPPGTPVPVDHDFDPNNPYPGTAFKPYRTLIEPPSRGRSHRAKKPEKEPEPMTPQHVYADHVKDAYQLFTQLAGARVILRHRSGRYYQKPVYVRWDDGAVRLYAMFRDGYLALSGNNGTSDTTVTWRTLFAAGHETFTDRLGRPCLKV